jgi:hypothetical protein
MKRAIRRSYACARTGDRSRLATDVGRERLEALHDVKFDDAAFQRFTAFLRQAEGLYMAADAMPPEPRPRWDLLPWRRWPVI